MAHRTDFSQFADLKNPDDRQTNSEQAGFGLVFGFIGLVLASPLTAVAVILVKMLYIENMLDDPIMKESQIVGNNLYKTETSE